MKDLLSTTSVPAIVESWRQYAASKIQSEINQSRVEVRVLTDSEKTLWKSKFAGKIHLPWFAAMYKDEVLVISDRLSTLIRELKSAGYSVYDTSTMA
jgi:hypothetical protein